MRPDAKVIYIDEQRQLENLEPGTIVFAASDTENMGKIFSDAQYSFVSSNYSFFAWKKE